MSKYKKFFGGVSSVVVFPSLLIILDGKKRKEKKEKKSKIIECKRKTFLLLKTLMISQVFCYTHFSFTNLPNPTSMMFSESLQSKPHFSFD